MPDPNKKLSDPSEDSPCEIKLACSALSAKTEAAEGKKKGTGSKLINIEEDKSQKAGKGCKSAAIEKQAKLNKEPCPSGTACHLARPDRSVNPASRIDNKKPGCINFESCDDEQEEETEEPKLESGCIDYEDCKEYLKEEKRRMKKMKDEAKQKKKEELAKAKAESNNKCSN